MSGLISLPNSPAVLPATTALPPAIAPGGPSLAVFVDLMTGKAATPAVVAAPAGDERQDDAAAGKSLPAKDKKLDAALAWLFGPPDVALPPPPVVPAAPAITRASPGAQSGATAIPARSVALPSAAPDLTPQTATSDSLPNDTVAAPIATIHPTDPSTARAAPIEGRAPLVTGSPSPIVTPIETPRRSVQTARPTFASASPLTGAGLSLAVPPVPRGAADLSIPISPAMLDKLPPIPFAVARPAAPASWPVAIVAPASPTKPTPQGVQGTAQPASVSMPTPTPSTDTGLPTEHAPPQTALPAAVTPQPASRPTALPAPTVPVDMPTPVAPAVVQPKAVPIVIAAPPSTPVILPALFALNMIADRHSTEQDDAPSTTPISVALQPAAMALGAIAQPGDTQRQSLDMGQRDWPQKMIEHIETLRDNADASDTSIRLKPEALGRVDVALKTHDDGAISVRFTAEQPTTRTLLADAAPQLAQAAEARGIRLSGTSVDLTGQGSDPRQRPEIERRQPTTNRLAASSGDDTQAVADGRVA